MSISRPYGHMEALRSSKSVPGAHLIGGESRSPTQSRSTRTKFGDQQYNRLYSTSRLRRTTVIDEARSSKDSTRASGIAAICLAKGLAGRAGSMPRNVA